MDEHAAAAVRAKRQSSIVAGLRAVRDGQADAFVSAGNTGAVMAGGVLVLGRIRGIERPALGAVFPTIGGGSVQLRNRLSLYLVLDHMVLLNLFGDPAAVEAGAAGAAKRRLAS